MKTLTLAAIRCSLMFTAVAALSFAFPVKANLIQNPGFETGDLTGWSGSHVAVVGTQFGISPHSGNFQEVNLLPLAFLSQTLATTPGQSYTIDLRAAATGIGLFF